MSGAPPPSTPPGKSLGQSLGRRHEAILIAAVAGFALSGCSLTVQTNPAPTAPPAAPADPADPAAPRAVAKAKLAQVLSDELTNRTGRQAESINCPNDLPVTAGAAVTCQILQGGQSVGTVTARVNDQGRINYNFDITVPTPAPPGPGG